MNMSQTRRTILNHLLQVTEATARDIADAEGILESTAVNERCAAMIRAGWIESESKFVEVERTGPNNVKHYRITDKGREMLAAKTPEKSQKFIDRELAAESAAALKLKTDPFVWAFCKQHGVHPDQFEATKKRVLEGVQA